VQVFIEKIDSEQHGIFLHSSVHVTGCDAAMKGARVGEPMRFMAVVMAVVLVASVLLAGCGSKAESCTGESPDLPLDSTLVADAGPDFEAHEGDLVALDGTASLSTSGGPFTYEWHQVIGPCNKLDLADPARPTLRAPHVEDGENVLVYRLHLVRDGKMSAGDEAEVVVQS
jgi:hypothetical protein